MMNKILILAATVMLCLTGTMTAQTPTDNTDVPQLQGCRGGTLNPQSTLRRTRALQDNKTLYTGNRRQLLVLAAFQDQAFTGDKATALAKWDKIFNQHGYNEGLYAGSVSDYFLSQSYGQFSLTFDLVYVELPSGQQKYHSTNFDDEFSQYMVDDIVDVLAEQNIDWSVYDWDGDTFVDQLLIIYAGEGMNAGGGSNTIWPHQWWLSQHNNLETDIPNDFRSYRTVAGSDKNYHIDCYCCVQETINSDKPETPFGTICHEYSHCFGLPDFYLSSGSLIDTWDLMDSGNYNGGGFRPCNYSAHERMVMGWISPIELTSPTSIKDMPALSDEPVAYLIRNDGWENEYYIVENRQKTGWDEDLPGSGILIFHVDYDEWLWKYEMPNSYSQKRYHIIPANNNTKIRERGNWPYPYIETDNLGNTTMTNDSLTNTSTPAADLNNVNMDGTMLMSKPITHMAVDDNGLASFEFMSDKVQSIHTVQEVPQSDAEWYTLDGRRLAGQPKARGLYIRGGKKIVMK